MLEKISQLDQRLFLFLNSFHSDFFDPIVYQFTQTLPWIPLYIFLSYLIIKTYGINSWWIFLAVGLTILLADQTTSALMKPYFERLRPCRDSSLEGLIHHYGNCSGGYSFASSHAANSFGIATIMTLGISHKYLAVRWLFLWAALFSYTRIYLGVHYPGDVIAGAMVGILSGSVSFYIFRIINVKVQQYKK